MASILITGASGFVGENLARRLRAEGHELTLAFHSTPPRARGDRCLQFDLSRPGDFTRAAADLRADLVVHTAALIGPDLCERNPDLARAVNAEGTREVGRWAASRQARLIYFSTDLVYDGESPPYTEESPPGPLNVYAGTKLQGEEEVRSNCSDWVVLRLALSYGPVRGHRGEWTWSMRKDLAEGKNLTLFTDQIRTPAYAGDTVEAVCRFVRNRCRGTFNLGGSESISRYDFGLQFARVFGLPIGRLLPVSMAEIPSGAPRPRDCSLDTEKLRRETGLRTCNVREGLLRQLAEEQTALDALQPGAGAWRVP